MRGMNTTVVTLAILANLATPALAADTTKVYSSGILVLAFVGLCALVILVQAAPAIMMLVGLVKGLVQGLRHRAVAEAKQRR